MLAMLPALPPVLLVVQLPVWVRALLVMLMILVQVQVQVQVQQPPSLLPSSPSSP
ncbi:MULTISPECIES: hypothetical protein [Stenotrophomonas maltophilia group]|uniref:hypothetical protein n=1 Tax=Stenotrophomonas maltophilia group TaxID=995085 RepID=UPI00215512F5|nr:MULTISPECIES: hypothetical protein [Stenotrophomonas maltophilia group]